MAESWGVPEVLASEEEIEEERKAQAKQMQDQAQQEQETNATDNALKSAQGQKLLTESGGQ